LSYWEALPPFGTYYPALVGDRYVFLVFSHKKYTFIHVPLGLVEDPVLSQPVPLASPRLLDQFANSLHTRGYAPD
jgi:hypothetical protein